MANNLVTKFTKLNNFINKNVFDKNEELKNITDVQKLEKQQAYYLGKLFKKVEQALNNDDKLYESYRYQNYILYDQMEQYPIIGRALELYSEEVCTAGDDGRYIKVHSDNKKTKRLVETLLFNVLNIQTNLPLWVKSLVKKGDMFIHWQLTDKGCVGCRMLPAAQVERIEGQYHEMIIDDNFAKDDVVFKWNYGGNIEFKWYQIGHFRLLMDDSRLPYGSSILNPAIRSWRNLLLVEDAMRAFRLLRGIERKLIYVDIGNIPPNQVEQFIQDVANTYKRSKKIDPVTGNVDLSYRAMSLDEDYIIPTRGNNDGSKIEPITASSGADSIADIEYELNQLYAALGIPKPFIEFGESTGEGNTLSSIDIRFCKRIYRIQQAIMMELNQLIMVHLLLAGYEGEVTNFKLTMQSPSMAEALSKVNYKQELMNLYDSATAEGTGGIAPMSIHRAKREIFGWSDAEIKLDMEQQRFEKAVAAELEKTPEVMPKTGYFDSVDNIYASINLNPSVDVDDSSGDDDMSGDMGDDFGGGGGGGFGDFGGGDDFGDFGSDDGFGDELDSSGDLDDSGGGESEQVADSVTSKSNLILEMFERVNKIPK